MTTYWVQADGGGPIHHIDVEVGNLYIQLKQMPNVLLSRSEIARYAAILAEIARPVPPLDASED